MALLWNPRASLTAVNGVAYEVQPQLTVRMADLRQLGQQGHHRGIIICIQTTAPVSENGDVRPSEKIKSESKDENERLIQIRKVWASLQVQNAKEFIADSTSEDESGGTEEIKAWCEALKLRG